MQEDDECEVIGMHRCNADIAILVAQLLEGASESKARDALLSNVTSPARVDRKDSGGCSLMIIGRREELCARAERLATCGICGCVAR